MSGLTTIAGFTADIIRTSNDQMGGGLTIGEIVLNNEQEHLEMASALRFNVERSPHFQALIRFP